MSLLQNVKVGTKLAVSSGIAVLLIAGMVANQQISSRAILAANQTVENEQTILDGIVNATAALDAMRFAEFRLRSATSSEDIRKAVEAAKNKSESAWSGLEKPIAIAKVPDILNEIRTEIRKFEQEIVEEAETRAKNIAEDGASASLQVALSDAAAKAEKAIEGSVQNARRFTEGAKVELVNAVNDANTVGLGIGLAVIALLIASAFLLMVSIARPIRSMTAAMRKLAAGDTQSTIPCVGQRDEIGEMAATVLAFRQGQIDRTRLEQEAEQARTAQDAQRKHQVSLDMSKAEDLKAFVLDVEHGFTALSHGDLTVRMTRTVAPEFEPIRLKFNDSIGQLEEALVSVIGAIGSIRVGLNQITVASGDLSQKTEQHAASLEETVAAITEVTNAVKGSADGADRAQASAVIAQRNAERGGEIVAKAIGAMSAIEQSSEKIGRIIGVIDEIAFQTNLLALNAGVEAARAGEAGRGFAVVAQEVRGLAQRSAEAAKEIKDLISMSTQQVEQGVELVTASGQSLHEIVTQVSEMSSLVVEIARSAKEQSISLKEVSVAAEQMDKVTQQNAAMVEETTAAAQSLSTETEDLSALMDRFQTKNAAGSRRETTRPNAAARRNGPSRSAPVAQLRTVSASKAAPEENTEWTEF